MSSGAPALKFEKPGDTHEGTITAAEVRQQTKFGTGEPEYWDNGNPKLELVITLNHQGDLGRIYAKGQMQAAIRDAVTKAGADGIDVSGTATLTIKYLRDEPSKTKGFHPQKIFAAKYTPPTPGQVTIPAAEEDPF